MSSQCNTQCKQHTQQSSESSLSKDTKAPKATQQKDTQQKDTQQKGNKQRSIAQQLAINQKEKAREIILPILQSVDKNDKHHDKMEEFVIMVKRTEEAQFKLEPKDKEEIKCFIFNPDFAKLFAKILKRIAQEYYQEHPEESTDLNETAKFLEHFYPQGLRIPCGVIIECVRSFLALEQNHKELTAERAKSSQDQTKIAELQRNEDDLRARVLRFANPITEACLYCYLYNAASALRKLSTLAKKEHKDLIQRKENDLKDLKAQREAETNQIKQKELDKKISDLEEELKQLKNILQEIYNTGKGLLTVKYLSDWRSRALCFTVMDKYILKPQMKINELKDQHKSLEGDEKTECEAKIAKLQEQKTKDVIAFRKQFKDKAKEKPADVIAKEKPAEEFSINCQIVEEAAEEAEKTGQQ